MDEEKKGTEEKEEDQNEKKKGFLRELLELLIYAACVAGLAFFLYHYVGQQVEVEGHSMMNTLNNGEHLILEKVSYRFGSPKRFDIIVFRPYAQEKETYYIKRIIGLPGESVQITGDDIYINGELLEEDFGREEIWDPGIAGNEILLGDDEYFVLGDNRNSSIDSRDAGVGLVKRDSIVGRAWLRIWPLDKIGVLSHR